MQRLLQQSLSLNARRIVIEMENLEIYKCNFRKFMQHKCMQQKGCLKENKKFTTSQGFMFNTFKNDQLTRQNFLRCPTRDG